jgi:hypothetical protein
MEQTRITNNAEEATMTYRRAVMMLTRMFPGRMFTYDDPKATVPAPGARFWSDELLADTDEREEAGAIPGDYVVHDGAIWLLQQDGNEYPVPMVQAIL